MFIVRGLRVAVDGKEILKGVNLEISEGEKVVLLGPNGSGKSTLAMAIVGVGLYVVTSGEIVFNGVRLNGLRPDERVKLGVTASFQFPPSIKGVTLLEVAKEIAKKVGVSSEEIFDWAEKLRLVEHLERDFNVGFSGGEKKRVELFLIALLRPKFVVFDEIDSGVDIESARLLARAIEELDLEGSLLITHTGSIAELLRVDRAYIMVGGRIVAEGDVMEVLSRVKKEGFGWAERS